MPENLSAPTAKPEKLTDKPPETKPDDSAEKIAALTQKISELESKLTEARKQPEAKPAAVEAAAKEPVKNPPKLPVVNRPGVTVSADDLQRIHIEIIDTHLFMPNTWQLTAEGEETLRTAAAEIKAFDPKVLLEIEGHTDSLMGDPKNPTQKHDISSIKAMAVMEFFINTLRWDAAGISTSSHGRSRPVADNGTPEGRTRNNRIEIVLRKE